MKKFPADVTTAESLVSGNVNIVNDPKFLPEKKQSYSEIFGSGKKKTKKETESPASKAKTPSSSNCKPYRPITHQRFINKVLHGETDHKVKTLIQPSASPEDSSKGIYRCHVCRFETTRVNVIVAHHRLVHSEKNSINWTGSETKPVRRKPVYKPRKTKVKRLFESPKADSSDDESLEKKRLKIGAETSKSPVKSTVSRKSTAFTPKKRKTTEENSEDNQKKSRFTDVLLADWSEEDEDEKKVVDTNKEENENQDIGETASDSIETAEKEDSFAADKEKDDSKNQNEKMSCFDFDEEEEGFIGMSNANTYGRKIPRVIPLKDKPELGVDLEIGELFKRKSDSEPDTPKEDEDSSTVNEQEEPSANETENVDKNDETAMKKEEETEDLKNKEAEQKPGKTAKRRRKSSKDQEIKVDEDSLAVRRARRPGARKSYLNEVIERVDDESSTPTEKIEEFKEMKSFEASIASRKSGKDDIPTSSSRRKQDLKLQTMDNNLEETIYSEIVHNEAKTSTDASDKKSRGKNKNAANDDLTRKIDNLLAETNVPNLPEIPSTTEIKSDNIKKSPDPPKPSNTLSLSFDYISPETDKTEKKAEVKSITKMFSDTIKENKNNEEAERASDDSESCGNDSSESKQETEICEGKPQSILMKSTSPGTGTSKETTAANSTISEESSDGKSEANEDSSMGEVKTDMKLVAETTQESAGDISDNSKSKNIKTLKLKADQLPSGLLTSAGKLKGQTIIHQKGGTYVILSQPPQLPRQKISAAKGQTAGKLVILTNQLGEQKIITASGLQQSKFKIEPQKLVVATTSGSEGTGSSNILSVGKTQPVIKMVPDGKGGVMKKLTVSPKKVLVGGTKVLVSGPGTTFSTQGNTIQKIALTGGNNLSGDYRLIENYKGSGKTVLIQGSSNAAAGVLKTGAVVQRQETIQGSPNILNVKKKPKILMRATPTQNEYVVHSEIATVDSPTYVMKTKGADGKFSTQKIIRRPDINAAKVKAATTGSKTFILSPEQPVQKGESLVIKTNHDPARNKIIRLTQKVPEMKQKFASKIIQKSVEGFTATDSILTATEPEQEMKNEATTQIIQVAQNQTQPILQTQVMAMPGPIGSDGNQTYVLVSVDEHGVVQPVDNSLITYDTTGQTEFVNQGSNNNVIVINQQTNEEAKPVFSNGSQDILAEALANTNVLEGSMNNEMEVMPSILLPPSIPSSVVQETSITLQKPIMTPLEMPTSVAPDTSGLEPPPLPPTPTEEDVLMEDQEGDMQAADRLSDERLIIESNKETKQGVLMEKNSAEENSRVGFIEDKNCEDYEGKDFEQDTPREEYIIENSQEEQGSGSLQSMPLLNDEPDTSDDAQGSEPIADQDFEVQKSRGENQDLSTLMREQEPPSSTNNEVMSETGFDKQTGTSDDTYSPVFQETPTGDAAQVSESEKTQEESKVKEVVENKEMQSMPVITDDGLNSYAFGQMYVDELSQKRFQEETEVTSTTDEYSNKDNNVV